MPAEYIPLNLHLKNLASHHKTPKHPYRALTISILSKNRHFKIHPHSPRKEFTSTPQKPGMDKKKRK